MFARSVNRNVVLAAAALTGVGTVVALAQESPPDLASYLARCASVKDPNLQVGCEGEQALKHAQDIGAFYRKGADAADKRIAATDKRIAATDERIAALQTEGTAIEKSIAASEKRTEFATAEVQCAGILKSGRESGVFNPDTARAILRDANKSLSDFGTCRLRDVLCGRMERPHPEFCRPT